MFYFAHKKMNDFIIIFSIVAAIIWGISFAVRRNKPELGKILSWVAIFILVILVILRFIF